MEQDPGLGELKGSAGMHGSWLFMLVRQARWHPRLLTWDAQGNLPVAVGSRDQEPASKPVAAWEFGPGAPGEGPVG